MYKAVLIAWYFSLCIVTILPNDISATFYRQCEADHNFIPPTTTLAPNSTNITETPVLQHLQGNISKYRPDYSKFITIIYIYFNAVTFWYQKHQIPMFYMC